MKYVALILLCFAGLCFSIDAKRDEVLRAFLDREDSCGGPTLDEQVMREVCRRLLDGKP